MRSARFLTDDGTIGIAMGLPEHFYSAAPYLLCHLNYSDGMFCLIEQRGLVGHYHYAYVGMAILLDRKH